MKGTADRIAEAGMALAAAAAAWILLSGPPPGGMASLAEARVQEVPSSEARLFQERLDEARVQVDGNQDAGPSLQRLVGDYPGRHEAWLLAARHAQASGRSGEALMNYARAVRMEPGYLDHGSPAYLGDRIGRLVDTRMAELLRMKEAGAMDMAARDELKAAYFLTRRLAGGCE